MGNLIVDRQFEFGGSHEALTSSLQQILDHINDHAPQAAKTDDVFFRYKIIITELLTNAIKHAGGEKTIVGIRINTDSLIISKTDNGKPLNLLDADDKRSPLVAGFKKSISADPIHLLYAVWQSENKIHFECDENDMTDPWDISDMMEHFGLLIITKSADDFFYTYDTQTKANVFTVKLKF